VRKIATEYKVSDQFCICCLSVLEGDDVIGGIEQSSNQNSKKRLWFFFCDR